MLILSVVNSGLSKREIRTEGTKNAALALWSIISWAKYVASRAACDFTNTNLPPFMSGWNTSKG